MKRDMDLIREILLKVEADDSLNGGLRPIEASELGIVDCDQMVFAYNAALLVEARMLAGNAKRAAMGDIVIGGLTWDGHEFLDTIRDTDVWRKTKAAAGKVGGASIALIWELAKAELRAKLGLP